MIALHNEWSICNFFGLFIILVFFVLLLVIINSTLSQKKIAQLIQWTKCVVSAFEVGIILSDKLTGGPGIILNKYYLSSVLIDTCGERISQLTRSPSRWLNQNGERVQDNLYMSNISNTIPEQVYVSIWRNCKVYIPCLKGGCKFWAELSFTNNPSYTSP
jgi:hypothetical protein